MMNLGMQNCLLPWQRFLFYTCSPERGPSGLLDTVGFDNEDVHGKHNGQEAGGPSTFHAPSARYFLNLYCLGKYN